VDGAPTLLVLPKKSFAGCCWVAELFIVRAGAAVVVALMTLLLAADAPAMPKKSFAEAGAIFDNAAGAALFAVGGATAKFLVVRVVAASAGTITGTGSLVLLMVPKLLVVVFGLFEPAVILPDPNKSAAAAAAVKDDNSVWPKSAPAPGPLLGAACFATPAPMKVLPVAGCL
jgi:hypothetical protein